MIELSRPYVYVVVREDIPLADQAVQACHAALEAGFAFTYPGEPASLILLGVANEESLTGLAKILAAEGIAHALFHEPDDDMGHSALATQPITGSARSHFRGLPLWRGDKDRRSAAT